MALIFPNKGTESEKIQFICDLLDFKGDKNKIKLEPMHGGITNSVYLFITPEKKSVVRVFGNNTYKIINRQAEMENIKTANLIKIYATFGNGMICSYQNGKAVNLDMMSDASISKKIAQQVGRLHRTTLFNSAKTNEIFDRIDVFISKLNPSFTKNGVHANIQDIKVRYSALKDEINELMKDRPVCLSHNDLLAGNILWDGKNVGLVDYEYSGYTWPEYDIANHFLEMCGFELDLKRFPDIEHQKRFIRVYLKTLYGKEQSEETVDEWQQRIDKLVNLSHMFWGSWAFFQAENSTVDFPYFEYGIWRIKLMDCHLPLPSNHEYLGSKLVDLN